jgi:hypothetical protein
VLPSRLNHMVAQLEDAVYSNRADDLLGLMRDLLPDFRAVNDTPSRSGNPADGEISLPGDNVQVTPAHMIKAV